MFRRTTAIALGALILGWIAATPRARACNEWNYDSQVVAVAPDGTMVNVRNSEGGTWVTEVEALDPDGRRRASCRVDEDEDRWRCHGDPAFRARAHQRLARVLALWTTAIGGATPTFVPVVAPPPGLIAAMCSRVGPLYLTGEPSWCDATTATIVTLPQSDLLFARVAIGPEEFCGATSSYQSTLWFSRDQLAQRLRRRDAIFTRRGQLDHARAARDALAWLTAHAAPAP